MTGPCLAERHGPAGVLDVFLGSCGFRRILQEPQFAEAGVTRLASIWESDDDMVGDFDANNPPGFDEQPRGGKVVG